VYGVRRVDKWIARNARVVAGPVLRGEKQEKVTHRTCLDIHTGGRRCGGNVSMAKVSDGRCRVPPKVALSHTAMAGCIYNCSCFQWRYDGERMTI